MKNIYKLENVYRKYKLYDESVEALSNISLDIKEGEMVVILGPSGSGKSTLLNVLSGIDNEYTGKIYFNNDRIDLYNDEKHTKYRKDYLGFIFQTYNLIPNLTVKENIEFGYQLSNNPFNVSEVIDLVGLSNMQNRFPYQLSGGQMQRVAIARALVKNPKVLFCDEPTGALDEKIGKKVLKVLQDINNKYKTTIIIVTHNPSIAKIANTVIKMNSGKITDIYKNNKVQDAENIEWA
ncbi:MAG TPA: ABC transporter ATP-binding protein [Bacilli bacterium]|nr:ABC transporter ATP-binding protein [Bacilli bacterium]